MRMAQGMQGQVVEVHQTTQMILYSHEIKSLSAVSPEQRAMETENAAIRMKGIAALTQSISKLSEHGRCSEAAQDHYLEVTKRSAECYHRWRSSKN